MKLLTLLLFFTLCQVIGTMCVLPDLATEDEALVLVEDSMVCPMDGTIMCPPSLTSSPERQVKPDGISDADQGPILCSALPLPTVFPVPTPWSWSNVFSVVPVPIASSSVLRI